MAPASSLPRDAVRVRMYRVGFGDCFLVSFPAGDGARHMLFDFGVHHGGDIGTMSTVLDSVESETDRRLAVVVATHEHADHISGYGVFASRFARFEIDEIWMPWAMDPDDPVAVDLRQQRLALDEVLSAHFGVGGLSGDASPAVLAILANLRGNDRARQALWSRFEGSAQRIRYLRAGQRLGAGIGQPDPAGIDGLAVRALGPSTDHRFPQRMAPPTSQMPPARLTPDALRPFPRSFAIDPGLGRRLYRMTSQDEARVAEALDGPPDELAFALDAMVNNTSLVLLLSFRGRALLFPGDAQWGSWKYRLESPEAGALLEQVAFLKVAHHGSYGATPQRALERMRKGAFAAFVSTQSSPWQTIPRESLIARLATQSRNHVLRSDSLRISGAPEGPKATLPLGFAQGDVWYDCMISL